MSIQQLVTQGVLPPALSNKCDPGLLITACLHAEKLGHTEASKELRLMYEEAKAKRVLATLCYADPVYKLIVGFMRRGWTVPTIVDHLAPITTKLRLSNMVSKVGEAIAYFHDEPKSDTLERLLSRR